MGVLKNPRHEKFAQQLAKGGSQHAAYAAAGFTGNRSAASTMAQKTDVIARVSELMTRIDEREEISTATALEKAKVTKLAIIEELKLIGFARMDMFFSLTSESDPYIDQTKLQEAEANWAAVKEIVVDEYTEGRGEDARDIKRIRFTLHDKKGALLELAKMHGMIAPPTLNQQNNQINVYMTDKQLGL